MIKKSVIQISIVIRFSFRFVINSEEYWTCISRYYLCFYIILSMHIVACHFHVYSYVYLESVDTSFKEIGCRVYRKSFPRWAVTVCVNIRSIVVSMSYLRLSANYRDRSSSAKIFSLSFLQVMQVIIQLIVTTKINKMFTNFSVRWNIFLALVFDSTYRNVRCSILSLE